MIGDDETGEIEIDPPSIEEVQQLLDQIEGALEQAINASVQHAED